MMMTEKTQTNLASKFKERVMKPLLLAVAITALIWGFSSKFTILPPTSTYPCLPGHIYLLDRNNLNIHAGDLVTFRAKGTKLFPDGTLFTKLVVGAAGDSVIVDRGLVSNGKKTYNTDISMTADYLHLKLDSLSRTEVIPKGKLFVIGTMPGSYDSRFWGNVDIESQVIGKTYVIF